MEQGKVRNRTWFVTVTTLNRSPPLPSSRTTGRDSSTLGLRCGRTARQRGNEDTKDFGPSATAKKPRSSHGGGNAVSGLRRGKERGRRERQPQQRRQRSPRRAQQAIGSSTRPPRGLLPRGSGNKRRTKNGAFDKKKRRRRLFSFLVGTVSCFFCGFGGEGGGAEQNAGLGGNQPAGGENASPRNTADAASTTTTTTPTKQS